MSGRLGLSTPWARQYLPEAMRPEVERRIPNDCVLGVGAIRKPGHWRIWMVREGAMGREVLWSLERTDSDLQRACLAALRHGCFLCGRESDMNVTVEGEVRGICSTCYERGQDEVRVPLSYVEDPDLEC